MTAIVILEDGIPALRSRHDDLSAGQTAFGKMTPGCAAALIELHHAGGIRIVCTAGIDSDDIERDQDLLADIRVTVRGEDIARNRSGSTISAADDTDDLPLVKLPTSKRFRIADKPQKIYRWPIMTDQH